MILSYSLHPIKNLIFYFVFVPKDESVTELGLFWDWGGSYQTRILATTSLISRSNLKTEAVVSRATIVVTPNKIYASKISMAIAKEYYSIHPLMKMKPFAFTFSLVTKRSGGKKKKYVFLIQRQEARALGHPFK